jgi:crotonobetainyl-CoA:carnitine CoA-transferase CaiB-like acyl-CoA transferase
MPSRDSATAPLAGIRVLDLTSVILGPYATQILADHGADVIKVEPPAGDNMRHAAPMKNPGMGHIFLHLNRNKRSLVLDLKHAAGRDAVLRLARSADVLVHNTRPEAMERLGLSYDAVREVKPDIVYVAAYGFRREGPYGGKAAYDDIIQGLIAIPALIGAQTGGRPRFVPATICDRITGLNTVNAIATALFHRERTGAGQQVEVTMFEALSEFVLSDHMGGETWRPAIGPAGYPRLLAPDRNPYRTRDGYLALLIYNDKQWRSFFAAIGKPELAEREPFSSQASRSRSIVEVYAYVAEELATRTTAEWLELFERADIPAMRLHDLESLVADPHLEAVGFFRDAEHPSEGPIRMMDVPARWSETPPSLRRHAPRLGEHSVEILAEAGYSRAEIDELLAAGTTLVESTRHE